MASCHCEIDVQVLHQRPSFVLHQDAILSLSPNTRLFVNHSNAWLVASVDVDVVRGLVSSLVSGSYTLQCFASRVYMLPLHTCYCKGYLPLCSCELHSTSVCCSFSCPSSDPSSSCCYSSRPSSSCSNFSCCSTTCGPSVRAHAEICCAAVISRQFCGLKVSIDEPSAPTPARVILFILFLQLLHFPCDLTVIFLFVFIILLSMSVCEVCCVEHDKYFDTFRALCKVTCIWKILQWCCCLMVSLGYFNYLWLILLILFLSHFVMLYYDIFHSYLFKNLENIFSLKKNCYESLPSFKNDFGLFRVTLYLWLLLVMIVECGLLHVTLLLWLLEMYVAFVITTNQALVPNSMTLVVALLDVSVIVDALVVVVRFASLIIYHRSIVESTFIPSNFYYIVISKNISRCLVFLQFLLEFSVLKILIDDEKLANETVKIKMFNRNFVINYYYDPNRGKAVGLVGNYYCCMKITNQKNLPWSRNLKKVNTGKMLFSPFRYCVTVLRSSINYSKSYLTWCNEASVVVMKAPLVLTVAILLVIVAVVVATVVVVVIVVVNLLPAFLLLAFVVVSLIREGIYIVHYYSKHWIEKSIRIFCFNSCDRFSYFGQVDYWNNCVKGKRNAFCAFLKLSLLMSTNMLSLNISASFLNITNHEAKNETFLCCRKIEASVQNYLLNEYYFYKKRRLKYG